nr:MAG TPA: hypothetical protein [Bacteriophage sp.]
MDFSTLNCENYGTVFRGKSEQNRGQNLIKVFNRFLDFKIAYDGGFKNFTLYFMRKFFQFLE